MLLYQQFIALSFVCVLLKLIIKILKGRSWILVASSCTGTLTNINDKKVIVRGFYVFSISILIFSLSEKTEGEIEIGLIFIYLFP